MKKIIVLVVIGVGLFQSCKEIGPQIDFGPGVAQGEDTAYMTSPETAQAKKVLAEEFTGVSCPPCPNGHNQMRSIKKTINGNMIVVAYHILNYPQAYPVEKDGALLSKYDFRTQDATDVVNNIFGGIKNMPVAAFDRKEVGGDLQLSLTQWSNPPVQRAALATPVNIHLESTYNSTEKKAMLKVKLAYTAKVDMSQTLNVMLVEDSIIDAQKVGLQIEKEYVHEHVLRKVITPIAGSILPEKVNPKEAGKVYERRFALNIDSLDEKKEWHIEHMHAVVFVTNDVAGDKTVVHAADVKLTGE